MSAIPRRHRILRRILAVLAGLFAIFIIFLLIAMRLAFDADGVTKGAEQKSVTSMDGTVIAYEQTGTGPVVILVASALADRGAAKRLAKHLSEHFTVINYDRRGRGKSGDTQPYAPEREVEDIDALIQGSGGSAFLFGSSSGAVLALDATSQLATKVKGLFMYEPPFIVDDSRPPMAEDLSRQVAELVSAGRSNDAVKLFFTKGMGIPPFGVTLMRLLIPGWSKTVRMAHTVPYDLAIVEGTQVGKPLPAKRWRSATAPMLVMVGSKSEPFFKSGAKSIVELLPNVKYRSLEGGNHGAVLFASEALAAEAGQFFLMSDTKQPN